MIRPRLLLCAEGVVRDAQTNTISVFNILEQLRFPSFPAAFPRFWVLSVLERDDDDPEEITTTLRIAIGEQIILEHNLDVSFQGQKRTRNIVAFGALPLPQPGVLNVSVSLDDRLLHQYEIEVLALLKPTIERKDQG